MIINRVYYILYDVLKKNILDAIINVMTSDWLDPFVPNQGTNIVFEWVIYIIVI